MFITNLTQEQYLFDQTFFNFDQNIENLSNIYLENSHTYNYILLGLIYLITIFSFRKNVKTILEYSLNKDELNLKENELKLQETILNKKQEEFKYQQEELYRKQNDIKSQELVLKYRIEDINRKESEIDYEYKMVFESKQKNTNNQETQVEIICKKRKVELELEDNIPIALSRPRRACAPTTFYKKF